MEKNIKVGNQTAIEHSGDYKSGYFNTFKSLNLDNFPRKVHVYLPRGYKKSTERYPVVYMNDGNTAFEPGGLSPWSWEVAKTLDSLYKKKAIPKLIIVAVYTNNRVYEYLKIRKFKGMDNVIDEGGGLPIYASYLAHKLKPFIDKNYRTKPEGSKTTIIGSSFGGVASFYTSITHPESFGNIGALSPSFWLGTRLKQMSFMETEFMQEMIENLEHTINRPKIWIDWSTNEWAIAKNVPGLLDYLKENFGYKKNKNLFYLEDEIGNHDERAWEYRLNILLQAFYGNRSI